MRRRQVALGGVAAVLLLAGAQFVALVASIRSPDAGAPQPASRLAVAAPGARVEPRTVAVYSGQGAWVDVYDFAPAFQGRGAAPAIDASDVDAMADHGVRTLYLQAAIDRGQDEPGLVAPDAVRRLVRRAHDRGLAVVAWYLPRFGDVARDVAFVEALADYEESGHRFDGVALDIEWTETVPDHEARSAQLVELSERVRDAAGPGAVGAIVPPPVQLEVVNRDLWPGFPWRDLAPLYDAWMTMGYWTDRRADSGHRHGHGYTVDNVERLRERLGDDEAVVHPIGGIGDAVTAEDITGYVDALGEVGAVGGSLYDWATLNEAKRAQLAQEMSQLALNAA
jgi:hypothetical protein